jgi:hypothetical protein
MNLMHNTIRKVSKMEPFIFNHWHAWQTIPNGKILLSDENIKKLYQFNIIDDCINWLYLNGEKECARALNSAINKRKDNV